MAKSLAAITICAKNYFAKAKVLRRSYLDYHPDSDFYILLVDRRDEAFVERHSDINILWVEDLPIEDVYKHAFTYDVIEFSTNVKPTALKYILRNYEKALYIDPDIQVYNHLTPVIKALDDHAITITPHTLTPVYDGKHPNDVDFLKFGAYNLGFVGVSRSEEGLKFLDWWSARSFATGFYEPQMGLAVDQKWVDLVPSYFASTKIMREPGLNLAFWNLHERQLSRRDNDWMVNHTSPLYFIHFSSFDVKNPASIASKQDRYSQGDRPDVVELFEAYGKSIQSEDSEAYGSNQYSFDFFEDGMYVTPLLRRVYACLSTQFNQDKNPFLPTSKIRQFGEKKGLISRKIQPANRQNFKSFDGYKRELKFIYMMMRIVLKIVGPVRYFALMRLLPHLSSIRNQKDVFSD